MVKAQLHSQFGLHLPALPHGPSTPSTESPDQPASTSSTPVTPAPGLVAPGVLSSRDAVLRGDLSVLSSDRLHLTSGVTPLAHGRQK